MQLKEYKPIHKKAIEEYYFENKGNYSRPPKVAVEDAENNEEQTPLLLFNDEGEFVSFLVLDASEYKKEFTSNDRGLLIRSVSTATNHEGNGYAKELMGRLPDFVRKNFSEINQLVLAVNTNNNVALRMYKKLGYRDTGDIVVGHVGPQHVMVFDL